ncbi:uncharacterized protein N7443_004321 [Penicillium atrosanguineum]|uniref:uncharacterized protein n=1 Tax=Penicillium atrosanguineum TaxID=1132637 RepID=UPI0023841B75|nr:uncharacterized protein N7443_004321 [Penicillium atrosanguineum]KAJ5304661.1 hypothetical protein N7443_004321 [Penicillium atrosanguineum]
MESEREGASKLGKQLVRSSPLLGLPNEILQHIASIIPTDRDVSLLSRTCKELHGRLLAPESTIWRVRFKRRYDLPQGRESRELKPEYQTRAIVLPRKLDFKQSENEQQKIWLQVVQTMVRESTTLPVEIETSKTYQRIQDIMTQVEFFSNPKRIKSSDMFCAVQLCLTPMSLDMTVTQACGRPGYDIGTVYSFQEDIDGPFIKHETLDLNKLLHIRSFWQNHLLNSQESTNFSEIYSNLPRNHKPKARNIDVANTSMICTSWFGLWSCIHPLPDTIEEFTRRESCADLEDHIHQVDVMTLELEYNSEEIWPEACASVISRYEAAECVAYFQGVQKIHGDSEAANPLFGLTESISFPYGGFKGWTRVCFCICEGVDENGDSVFNDDDSWVHGYEGVIPPGSGVMLGRWLDLKDTSGRGPFLFWDV